MTQERQAFERWVETQYFIAQGKIFEKCFYGGWQASRESLKQELLSDEMVEIAEKAYNACVDELGDQAYERYCNEVPLKAALQAVVEGI